MFKADPAGPLILASSSPRRRELLSGAGVEFKIEVPDCDEDVIAGETPEAMVKRLAHLKAHVVAKRHPDAWVIGADTTVSIDGEILGKPEDQADARRMLAQIQGRTHTVWGGFAVIKLAAGARAEEVHQSQVRMIRMSQAVIEEYVKSGEPMDKAGSYAIQGIGAALVQEVQGSYTNVVGLNLAALLERLIALGALRA